MTVDLISENEKKGTVQVVVVSGSGGRSATRQLRFAGTERRESLRDRPFRVRIYTDSTGVRFVRLGDHFSIDRL
jgi:hypothetical protein